MIALPSFVMIFAISKPCGSLYGHGVCQYVYYSLLRAQPGLIEPGRVVEPGEGSEPGD